MNHDVGSVLNWVDEVRRAEGVVDDQWYAMLVGNLGRAFYVGDVGVGVAQRLNVHELCVWLDGRLQCVVVVGVHKRGVDAIL